MPFKTQYGSHYHMTEGCHGATIPCGTEGLTPCSDCCGGGDGLGAGTPDLPGGGDMGGGSLAGGEDSPYGTGNEDATEGATVSGTDLKTTFWKTQYAYFGKSDGMSRPFRLDVSSTENGELYWRITAAYDQIDDALVPIGSSFGDNLDDAYVPAAGQWSPQKPRTSGDGSAVGSTFRSLDEALADANSFIAGLGITDDTDSIAWCREHLDARDRTYATVSRSTEATELGVQGMADGMPLADGMDVTSIARHLSDSQGDGHEGQRLDSASWNRDSAYQDADLTESARRQLRRGVGYRSEMLFGEGYTEAASVLTHETFAMQNTDIIDMLSDTILAGTETGQKLAHISAVMTGAEEDPELEEFLNRVAYDDCAPEGVALFQDEVLPAIRKATGYEVNHVMWLCDSPGQVIGSYGDIGDITEDDIDEHGIGGVMLSDIGEDGVLWGYTDPIDKPDDGWGWW